jgi:hypothetical protein
MRLKIIGWLSIIFIGSTSSAQSPDMYPPTVPEPVKNPVLYIALTLAVIAIYFIYRYSQKKKRKKKNQVK